MPSIEFVPMALFCFCKNGLGVGCDLFRLHLTVHATSDNITFVSWSMDAPGSGLTPISVSGPFSTYDSDINLAWANLPMVISFDFARSLLSEDDGLAGIAVSAYAELACANGEKLPISATFSGGNNCQCYDDDGLRAQATMAAGSVGAFLIRSSPLADCNGCRLDVASIIAVPDPQNAIDSQDVAWCVCATGGTVQHNDDGTLTFFPKKYYIESGHLSGGQSLDEDTGCVVGVADPKHPASPEITIKVVDVYSGESATLSCGIFPSGCTGSEGVSSPNNYTYAQ